MTIDPHPHTKLQAIEQALQVAVAQHQAGQLEGAEKLYRAILQIGPHHPEANHNMGVLLVQKQQFSASLPYFMTALDAEPDHGKYWLSYIDALFHDGQLETARQLLTLAQQQGLQGEEADYLKLCLQGGEQLAGQSSGNDLLAHKDQLPVSMAMLQHSLNKTRQKPGKQNKSVTHSKKNPNPQEINSLFDLINRGQVTEAVSLAQKLTARFPQNGVGWKALGVMLNHMGANAEALVPMQKTVSLLPNDAEAHNNLGITLHDLGRLDEAVGSYQRAIKINPGYAQAYINLATTLQSLGMLNKAESFYRQALKIKPDFPDALNKMGTLIKILGRLEEADACFRQALERQPDLAEAHNNLGSTLVLLERAEEAQTCFRRALQIKPDLAVAHSNLGSLLYDLGRLDEAETFFRRSIQIDPNLHDVHSNLLFCLVQNAAIDSQTLFLEHRRFGEKIEAGFLDQQIQHANSRNPDRIIQVGFVSGDFRDHAVAYFIESVLTHFAGCPQLSLHAYYNHSIDDSITQRMRRNFSHWHSIIGLSDEKLAEKIRADGIDILIDLSGHTAKNRLMSFARKPAPVQASWMGYPGTTGLKAMDYYFSDRFFLPPGHFDSQFTEKIVRLPASAPFLPHRDAPPVNILPALSNGYITFGSFNRLSKLSQTVIALWAQLLRILPDSRMVLGGLPEEGKYEMLIEWFALEGIARERLDFHPRSGMDRYLILHQQVDICLDTFPFNGGTTTLHALWMGVPTLTLVGGTAAGRSGACILGHVGLDATVAHDAADFVRKGLSLAGNLVALSEIRTGLRERFAKSAIGQPEIIAAGLERALRLMWQRWCAGLPAESFEVTRQEIAGGTLDARK